MKPQRLKNRAQFVRLTKHGQKVHKPAFVIQFLPNSEAAVRVGFTASKKVGGAVQRNRAKRRLRALVDAYFKTAQIGQGLDIVVVARAAATEHDFAAMQADFTSAMAQVTNR